MIKLIKEITSYFLLIALCTFFITFSNVNKTYADNSSDKKLVSKISKDFTNKFCNGIAFGLSKESAMNFAIEENKITFQKKKGIDNLDKREIASKVSTLVVDKCGYPLNLLGEKGANEFQNYYLSKTS